MGGRKRHPPCGILLPAAMGVEQQVAIAALHHADAEADETDRAAAQIMRLPAVLGHFIGAEQSAGDLAVARMVFRFRAKP